jgi:hypothetical protein
MGRGVYIFAWVLFIFLSIRFWYIGIPAAILGAGVGIAIRNHNRKAEHDDRLG